MFQPRRENFEPESPRISERYAGTRQLISDFDGLAAVLPLSNEEREKLELCKQIAVLAHFDQADRAEGQPYINHPLRVAIGAIRDFGVTEPASIMAALLHDTVEDAPLTTLHLLGETTQSAEDPRELALKALAKTFGDDTAARVAALTTPRIMDVDDDKPLSPAMRSTQRNLLYYLHFFGILRESPEAFVIKLSDFSDNALKLREMPEGEKKEGLRAKYGPVLLELISAFEGGKPLPKELEQISGPFLERLRAVRGEFYKPSQPRPKI